MRAWRRIGAAVFSIAACRLDRGRKRALVRVLRSIDTRVCELRCSPSPYSPKTTAMPGGSGGEDLTRAMLRLQILTELARPAESAGRLSRGNVSVCWRCEFARSERSHWRMPRLTGSCRAGVAGVDWSPKLDLPTSRWIIAQAWMLTAATHSRLVGRCFLFVSPQRPQMPEGRGVNALGEFKSLAGKVSLRRHAV